MRLAAVAGIFLSSLAVPAFARADGGIGGIPLATCPTPETFLEIREWIKRVDTQKLVSKLPPADTKDHKSKLGFIIRESCFKGPLRETEDERKEVIRHYERAAAYMLQQTSRCFKAFNFGSIASIPALLGVTKIECKDQEGLAGAEATLNVNDEHPSAVGKRTVTLNTRDLKDFQGGPEALARLLFHELLHFTPSMNRAWHADAPKRGPLPCDRSALLDRVYFMQTACFPFTSEGFWGIDSIPQEPAARSCKNLCDRALSEVDDPQKILATIDGAKPEQAEFIVASPLQPSARAIICNRIKNATAAVHAYWKEIYGLEVKFRRMRSRLPYDLQTRIDDFFKLLQSPAPVPEARKKVDAAIASLEPEIRAYCAKISAPCGSAGVEPYLNLFAKARSLLGGIKPDQYPVMDLTFRKAPELP